MNKIYEIKSGQFIKEKHHANYIFSTYYYPLFKVIFPLISKRKFLFEFLIELIDELVVNVVKINLITNLRLVIVTKLTYPTPAGKENETHIK